MNARVYVLIILITFDAYSLFSRRKKKHIGFFLPKFKLIDGAVLDCPYRGDIIKRFSLCIYHIQKSKIEMIFSGFKGRVKTKLMTNVMH